MATLLFTALGTLIGGPIGGVIGALAGQQVDTALIGSPTREGARLKDLTVTTSSYGSPLPRHFGQMRVGGTIIWATDLVEHQSTSGGGKGKPKITSYSYTSSFAVALSSRPIHAIGRIWADGNLLRGAAGDLKVGGTLRIYTGQQGQMPDPLISASEGADNCPAFRGTAYVVFDSLQLADFGNRIPTLSFEVFADNEAPTLAHLFEGVIEDVDADISLDGISGFTCEGPLGDTLALFQPVLPMNCDGGGARLTVSRERLQTAPIMLQEPAVSHGKGDFGAKAGYSRTRSPLSENPPRVLRYYDVGLDYQPGAQRTAGHALSGQPRTIEVPAAMAASDAFQMISLASRNANWGRETIAWRIAQLDPDVAPGTVVTVPGQAGNWRVKEWEWRASGVELTLNRIAPSGIAGSGAISAGRPNLAADVMSAPTQVVAFELPWTGTGSSDTIAMFAAVSSASKGWNGAEIYLNKGDGALASIGSSGRRRSTIGTSVGVLPPGSPYVVDRTSSVTVSLLGNDMTLRDASVAQLASGANRALIGSEIIQFGQAVPLGAGLWRLGTLLRGRGGTESAIFNHVESESFVLLDDTPIALDAAIVGSNSGTRIAALGLGDAIAAESHIIGLGRSLKPMPPVHSRVSRHGDGGLSLRWTRRARGGWLWQDGVDTPLQEQSETYLVSFGPHTSPVARWVVTQPSLELPASTVASLEPMLPQGPLYVQQQGTFALSEPLLLTHLN